MDVNFCTFSCSETLRFKLGGPVQHKRARGLKTPLFLANFLLPICLHQV